MKIPDALEFDTTSFVVIVGLILGALLVDSLKPRD